MKTRPVAESDMPFIYSTWLRGLYYGSDYWGAMQKDKFFKMYQQILQHILGKATTSVTVACDDQDPDVILGYLVREDSVVHWVHVKDGWRSQGIARSLVGGAPVLVCTHLTAPGRAIANKKKIAFNPFLL